MSNDNESLDIVRKPVRFLSQSTDQYFVEETQWKRCVLPWLAVALLLLFVCHTVLRALYVSDSGGFIASAIVVPLWAVSLFCCIVADVYWSAS